MNVSGRDRDCSQPGKTHGGEYALERDAAELLYSHGISSVLVSLFAAAGLTFISVDQVRLTLLIAWWLCISAVLMARGLDILHFHRRRKRGSWAGRGEIRRFGAGVVGTALLWALFPVLMMRSLSETGRAYMTIVLCGMVGGSATVLSPSKTLSLVFCALLVLPASTLFVLMPGTENHFLGVLGYAYFLVMFVSSRVTNRATMRAIRLSRANEELVAEMTEERGRTEDANRELEAAQVALSEANQFLEKRIEIRTADLEREIRAKERYSKDLARLAATDSLTGLWNRGSLRERLRSGLELAERHGQKLAVLFLDLDKFKEVNDLFGHMAGDRVLQVVAERLLHCMGPGVELARWGGDEFVIALPGLSNESEALRLASQISTRLGEPIDIAAGVARVQGTIGIALYPQHGGTEEELIRAADVAMYAGKQGGGSRIRVFDPQLGKSLTERHRLEYALRQAIEGGALSVVFQPIIHAASGRCETLEALVRWHHPKWGTIDPHDFIPAAERTGEIAGLGRWVLLRACREAAGWPGDPPPSVSVNVSALQVEGGRLTGDVQEALHESGLPAERLRLELTESVFAADQRDIVPTLTRLRIKGIRISLDDFGTGFSCLAALRKLPVDQLKIDRSFVESLDIDSGPLVKVIVATAQTFGLEVVAEGVETPRQAERLVRLGVRYLQGYLFSSPLSPEDTRRWLSERRAITWRASMMAN